MRSMSTLPHHVSNCANDDLRKVISQTINLAGDAVEFPSEVIEPRMHVALNVPQLAGDEAEQSRHRLTIRRFMPANQPAARQVRWELVAAAMHHEAGSRRCAVGRRETSSNSSSIPRRRVAGTARSSPVWCKSTANGNPPDARPARQVMIRVGHGACRGLRES